MDRERYGGGRGGGGINRYPDVSGRNRQAPPREDRGRGRSQERAPSAPAARRSDEPWSDVPPELEAMLRAQVAQRPAGSGATPATVDSTPFDDVLAPETEVAEVVAVVDAAAAEVTAVAKPRATRKTAATTAKPAAKPRATRKTATAASADADTDSDAAAADAVADAPAAKPAAKPRAPRKTSTKAATDAGAAGDDSASPTAAAPKKRTTRKAAASAETA